jgi:hypothetical protein
LWVKLVKISFKCILLLLLSCNIILHKFSSLSLFIVRIFPYFYKVKFFEQRLLKRCQNRDLLKFNWCSKLILSLIKNKFEPWRDNEKAHKSLQAIVFQGNRNSPFGSQKQKPPNKWSNQVFFFIISKKPPTSTLIHWYSVLWIFSINCGGFKWDYSFYAPFNVIADYQRYKVNSFLNIALFYHYIALNFKHFLSL